MDEVSFGLICDVRDELQSVGESKYKHEHLRMFMRRMLLNYEMSEEISLRKLSIRGMVQSAQLA